VNIARIVSKNAQRFPQKVAIVDEGQRSNYQELDRRVNQLGNALLARGIEKGDKIGLFLPNCKEFLESFFAVTRIGAVVVPINFRLIGKEISYVLNDAEAKALIFSRNFQELIWKTKENFHTVKTLIEVARGKSSLLHYEDLVSAGSDSEPTVGVEMDDIALIMYTSGTTGFPKGAMLSHGNLFWNSVNVNSHHGFRPEDVSLILLPLFHTAGLNFQTIPVLQAGGSVVLLQEYDARRILSLFKQEKVSSTFLLPYMWKEISEIPDLESWDIFSLRLMISGSSPTPIPVIQRLGKVFKGEYVLNFGMTEAGLNCVLDSRDIVRKNLSIGKPTMFVEMRIIDEQGKDVAIDEVGEIVLRGPTVTPGYFKLGKATEEAKKGGWFHSGDLAKFDREGFIFIADRKKDMIKSGGENVYSREVESVLESHPKISEAAVIGVPDEKWDEAVKAFIVLKAGEQLTSEEVIAYCKEHLAGFKKPKHVQFVSALPRNAVNRVMKGDLRKMNKENEPS